MKRTMMIFALAGLVFCLGCAKNQAEDAEEKAAEVHAMVVTSSPAREFNQENYREYVDKLVDYSQEPNNKVDRIYFTGQYARKIMGDFQSSIDMASFPENILLTPVPDSLDVGAQIRDFEARAEEDGLNVYKLTIFGETYSQEEALAAANDLYNEFVTDEDREKMKQYLEEWQGADFETMKTELHVLKKRDFAKDFFSETPEVSYREFNLLIPEEEKMRVIRDFFLNTVDYLQNY